MDIIGKKLGQYQVVEELGRGGMAVVYKAYHAALNRYVAIKVLPPQFTFDQEFVQRFVREARSAAALHHPNIVTIHDVTQADGYYFIVMQFIEGKTLDQLIAECGRLPLPRIERIMTQVVDALEHAHQRGLIHRDIKPSNIMVDERDNDRVTLMDFGLVRAAEDTSLTRTGTIVGTPEYMSPEQAEGGEIDERTDIYSLGVVLFKMLTGRVPFSKSTPHAVLIAHMTQEPPSVSSISPGLSTPVEAVIRKALIKEREGRYARVGDFGRDLTIAIQGKMPPGLEMKARRKEAVSARPQPTRKAAAVKGAEATVVSAKPAPKAGGRGWMYALGGVGALFFLVLCGVAAVFLMGDDNGGPQPTATSDVVAPATQTATSTVMVDTVDTMTPTGTAASTGTPTPEASPSPSPTATGTATGTATATVAPTATSTPRPLATPTSTPLPPTEPPPPPPTDPPPPPPTDPPPPPPPTNTPVVFEG